MAWRKPLSFWDKTSDFSDMIGWEKPYHKEGKVARVSAMLYADRGREHKGKRHWVMKSKASVSSRTGNYFRESLLPAEFVYGSRDDAGYLLTNYRDKLARRLSRKGWRLR